MLLFDIGAMIGSRETFGLPLLLEKGLLCEFGLDGARNVEEVVFGPGLAQLRPLKCVGFCSWHRYLKSIMMVAMKMQWCNGEDFIPLVYRLVLSCSSDIAEEERECHFWPMPRLLTRCFVLSNLLSYHLPTSTSTRNATADRRRHEPILSQPRNW